MAARSTSAQFNTCHAYPSPSQREKHTHTHTWGPSGVFVFLFVSICSESGTWHLLGEQTSPMRPPGLSYVWMQTSAHHAKLIKSKSKVRTLNFTVESASLLPIIFTHKITACNHMNIRVLITYTGKPPPAPPPPCFLLELKFAAR